MTGTATTLGVRPCTECGSDFERVRANQVTCSPDCRAERKRRLTREWYYRQADVKAQAAERRRRLTQQPGYADTLAVHQRQLRQVWSELGLPLQELVDSSFYHGGFSALQAVEVLNAGDAP